MPLPLLRSALLPLRTGKPVVQRELPFSTVIDVTFHGEAATQPVISQLSRTYNIDISILGAAMDTVAGRQVGRMRIELPGRFEENVVPIGFLREQGLQVDIAGHDVPAPQDATLVKEGAK